MSGKLLISIFAGLLFAAYAGQGFAGEPKRSVDPQEQECTGDFRNARIEFDIDRMEADKYCVRARLGTTIVLRLVSDETLKGVTVSIDPRDSFDDFWLKKSNEHFEDVILIKVPGRYDPTARHFITIHEFDVLVNDEKIDPRIEIEH